MNTLTLYNFYYYTNFDHFTRTCSRGEWNFFLLPKWACWIMHLFIWIDRSTYRWIFTPDIFLPIVIYSYGYVLFGGIKENCLLERWLSG
jgi:hypothetical protein